MEYPRLNLPAFDFNIREEEGHDYVFDITRKKYLLLTPEEWVRQHFIHLLINQLAYPRGLITTEQQHQYFKSAKRTDILCRNQAGEAVLLVECKAPSVSLDNKVLTQIAAYNKTLNARYIAITNGMKHYVWVLEGENYRQLDQFPVYPKPD